VTKRSVSKIRPLPLNPRAVGDLDKLDAPHASDKAAARPNMTATVIKRVAVQTPVGRRLVLFQPPVRLPETAFELDWHRRSDAHSARRWFRDFFAERAPALWRVFDGQDPLMAEGGSMRFDTDCGRRLPKYNGLCTPPVRQIERCRAKRGGGPERSE